MVHNEKLASAPIPLYKQSHSGGDSDDGDKECRKGTPNDFHNGIWERYGGDCASGHNTCGGAEEVLSTFMAAYREHDEDALLRLADANAGVAQINRTRSAVQLVDCQGGVVAHIPVSRAVVAAWIEQDRQRSTFVVSR
jgi:hypothetical protein